MRFYIQIASLFLLLLPVTGAQAKSLDIELSQLAKDEMSIVSRLQNLRKATQGLPENWKTKHGTEANLKDKRSITKAELLHHLGKMEMLAAERWTLLIQNLANLKTPRESLDAEAVLWRQDLQKLPKLQQHINHQLDQYNAILKDGILMNLARSIQVSTRATD